jgi:DNA replication protein DnaC
VPELVPNLFDFNARLRCPACRCARALCPPEFHTTSFETFDTSTPERATTLAIAREFAAQVNNRGCGFALFVGTTGPGKTRLACNIVQALDNGDSLYVRHGELTAALRATYRNNVEYDDEGERIELENPLEVTRGVRFLVLDEIGCTALANDERILLDELLKHRYDQNKPTILISNLPLDQFKEFVGDALHDRIRHAAGNGKFFVQFKGESYRRNMSDSYLEGRA